MCVGGGRRGDVHLKRCLNLYNGCKQDVQNTDSERKTRETAASTVPNYHLVGLHVWMSPKRDAFTYWLSSRSRMKDVPKASTKKLLCAKWMGWEGGVEGKGRHKCLLTKKQRLRK